MYFILVYSQRKPTISYITQTTIKDIGDAVELKCSVLYTTEYPVLWLKIDNERILEPVVLSNKNTIIIKNPRFSLLQDTENYSYILKVP